MDIPYGYLYVATGEKHLKECAISVNSLRKHDAKAHITLITDKECSIGSLFDNIIIKTESVEQPYMYKIKGIIATPYPFTLFVDTDTYFCDSCRELFDLLSYYDCCIAPCPNDNSDVFDEKGRLIKGYYPYNTGVIAYQNNRKMNILLTKWAEAYARHFNQYIHDQPPFMEALLSCDVKLYVMSTIYNARTPYPSMFIGKPVKIIHGRHKNYERIERILNKQHPYSRVWFPRFHILLYFRRTLLFRLYMQLPIRYRMMIKGALKKVRS